jgi:hypothetical protein
MSLFLVGLVVSAPLFGECPPVDMVSGVCYQPCISGFSPIATVCYSDCPPGYKDAKVNCRKDTWTSHEVVPKKTYGRLILDDTIVSNNDQIEQPETIDEPEVTQTEQSSHEEEQSSNQPEEQEESSQEQEESSQKQEESSQEQEESSQEKESSPTDWYTTPEPTPQPTPPCTASKVQSVAPPIQTVAPCSKSATYTPIPTIAPTAVPPCTKSKSISIALPIVETPAPYAVTEEVPNTNGGGGGGYQVPEEVVLPIPAPYVVPAPAFTPVPDSPGGGYDVPSFPEYSAPETTPVPDSPGGGYDVPTPSGYGDDAPWVPSNPIPEDIYETPTSIPSGNSDEEDDCEDEEETPTPSGHGDISTPLPYDDFPQAEGTPLPNDSSSPAETPLSDDGYGETAYGDAPSTTDFPEGILSGANGVSYAAWIGLLVGMAFLA